MSGVRPLLRGRTSCRHRLTHLAATYGRHGLTNRTFGWMTRVDQRAIVDDRWLSRPLETCRAMDPDLPPKFACSPALRLAHCAGPLSRSAKDRVDQFAKPSANGRSSRIPAEDRNRRRVESFAKPSRNGRCLCGPPSSGASPRTPEIPHSGPATRAARPRQRLFAEERLRYLPQGSRHRVDMARVASFPMPLAASAVQVFVMTAASGRDTTTRRSFAATQRSRASRSTPARGNPRPKV